jgi:signal transduction histidine kinase
MRWPLRIQILAPLTALMLITLVGVSLLNAYLSARLCRQHIQEQLASVVRTLNESSIPINSDRVLAQMQGLSGAEYVLTDSAGAVLSASRRDLPLATLSNASTEAHHLTLDQKLELGNRHYFHATAAVNPRRASGDSGVLHILFPEENYQALVRQGFVPPLIVGGVALALAIVLGAVMAAHVTRPIGRLRRHVQQISQGNFQPLALPARNDELRDLASAVNHMAGMLAKYEGQVRRNEKLRTLGQLGGGLAHQLRNSATGCRMALDLHRRECPRRDDCENLDVAARQLTLMERYLERFLSLGSGQPRPPARLDLADLLKSAVALVRPAAKHHGVGLEWAAPAAPLAINGDPAELEQVFVNLLINALEAAVGAASRAAPAAPPNVAVETMTDRGSVLIEVSDNGPGPAPGVRDSLFEPLVTDKADGTGLGLAVAREIVERHAGRIAWQRCGERTCFQVRLPLAETRDETGCECKRQTPPSLLGGESDSALPPRASLSAPPPSFARWSE